MNTAMATNTSPNTKKTPGALPELATIIQKTPNMIMMIAPIIRESLRGMKMQLANKIIKVSIPPSMEERILSFGGFLTHLFIHMVLDD